MPILQLIISVFFVCVFLVFLFFVLGYVILPLVILLGAIGGIRLLYAKIITYRKEKQANGCSIKRTYKNNSKTKHSEVIDVDYTEVK